MASTRTVYRGNRGRFAGSSHGKAETVKSGGFANAAFRARVLSNRSATRANVRPSTRGASRPPTRSKSRPPAKGGVVRRIAGNKKVQIGVATAAVGVGGYLAYNKVNPGTSLRRSGIHVPGDVMRYGGKSSARPEFTVVTNATHRFTTSSQGKGRKKHLYTVIEKKTPKSGFSTIGYVDSKRGPLGGYKVTHSYLTRVNRGKGLGKQAIVAHAAHRPNRTFRADVNRSTMGQGLAKSMGAAGRRSGKSKAHATDITKALDYDWRTASKNIRTSHAKNVIKTTKGMSPHKIKGATKIKKGRKKK